MKYYRSEPALTDRWSNETQPAQGQKTVSCFRVTMISRKSKKVLEHACKYQGRDTSRCPLGQAKDGGICSLQPEPLPLQARTKRDLVFKRDLVSSRLLAESVCTEFSVFLSK